jgi:hypothetical protein
MGPLTPGYTEAINASWFSWGEHCLSFIIVAMFYKRNRVRRDVVIAIQNTALLAFIRRLLKYKGNCLHVENQTGYKGEKAGPVRTMNTVA